MQGRLQLEQVKAKGDLELNAQKNQADQAAAAAKLSAEAELKSVRRARRKRSCVASRLPRTSISRFEQMRAEFALRREEMAAEAQLRREQMLLDD